MTPLQPGGACTTSPTEEAPIIAEAAIIPYQYHRESRHRIAVGPAVEDSCGQCFQNNRRDKVSTDKNRNIRFFSRFQNPNSGPLKNCRHPERSQSNSFVSKRHRRTNLHANPVWPVGHTPEEWQLPVFSLQIRQERKHHDVELRCLERASSDFAFPLSFMERITTDLRRKSAVGSGNFSSAKHW